LALQRKQENQPVNPSQALLAKLLPMLLAQSSSGTTLSTGQRVVEPPRPAGAPVIMPQQPSLGAIAPRDIAMRQQQFPPPADPNMVLHPSNYQPSVLSPNAGPSPEALEMLMRMKAMQGQGR